MPSAVLDGQVTQALLSKLSSLVGNGEREGCSCHLAGFRLSDWPKDPLESFNAVWAVRALEHEPDAAATL